jgi:hypothetical protein
MDHLPSSLQALIQSTDALDLDSPLLASLTESPQVQHGAFSLLGQLLSPKPMNSQTVRDTLQHAWKFALPLSFAVVGHHKYLFGISNQEHIQSILDQGPWNVRGSLLLLKPWSPDLALDEVNLNLCPFWVQVHGLPCQNMAAVNAVIIAQRLGKILAVDHHDAKGLICQPFLRFRVELDTSQPLLSGFHLPRTGRDPLWISFRYERLGDYCTLCGLIGHKRTQCIQPSHRHCPDKYRIPLQTFSLVGLRSSSHSTPSREDSDSGLSSVGTSHSLSDARSSPAHGAELSLQLVPSPSVPLPSIHVESSLGYHDMQIQSQTSLPPHVLFSPPAGSFLHQGYVSSPQQFHLLPLDFCTRVGDNPFVPSSSTILNPCSLPATSPLGSRLSAMDKGKGPLSLIPSTSQGFFDPVSTLSLSNISHPCPITISSPHSHPAQFSDFLGRWPYPFSPLSVPSHAIPLAFHSPLGSLSSSPPVSSSIPGPCPITSVAAPAPHFIPPPLSHAISGRAPFQIYPPYTSVTLAPATVSHSLAIPPKVPTESTSPSSPPRSFHHSPTLSRFHPYTKQSDQPASPKLPLPPDAIRLRSPSPVIQQAKRKLTTEDVPLAVLKKHKSHPLYPGLFSNLELAAISLTSLQDGDASVGSFLSIDQKESDPLAVQETGTSQPVSSIAVVPSGSLPDPLPGSTSSSVRPLRRFTRAARGLDVFSQLQASHAVSSPAGTDSVQAPEQKGVDQEGLPPHQ